MAVHVCRLFMKTAIPVHELLMCVGCSRQQAVHIFVLRQLMCTDVFAVTNDKLRADEYN